MPGSGKSAKRTTGAQIGRPKRVKVMPASGTPPVDALRKPSSEFVGVVSTPLAFVGLMLQVELALLVVTCEAGKGWCGVVVDAAGHISGEDRAAGDGDHVAGTVTGHVAGVGLSVTRATGGDHVVDRHANGIDGDRVADECYVASGNCVAEGGFAAGGSFAASGDRAASEDSASGYCAPGARNVIDITDRGTQINGGNACYVAVSEPRSNYPQHNYTEDGDRAVVLPNAEERGVPEPGSNDSQPVSQGVTADRIKMQVRNWTVKNPGAVPTPTCEDYALWSVAQLRKECSERKLRVPRKLGKLALVEHLKRHDATLLRWKLDAAYVKVCIKQKPELESYVKGGMHEEDEIDSMNLKRSSNGDRSSRKSAK
ncbi:hypothetical protein PInf_022439 [Phytophthora infestans]|nr:hypothetical protein PInf_022439 [Phytophthora infestans]